jgi:hypothetical protein
LLLEAVRGGELVFAEADGCGEEEIGVSSFSAVASKAKDIGSFLARHQLGERVVIRVACAERSGAR